MTDGRFDGWYRSGGWWYGPSFGNQLQYAAENQGNRWLLLVRAWVPGRGKFIALDFYPSLKAIREHTKNKETPCG